MHFAPVNIEAVLEEQAHGGDEHFRFEFLAARDNFGERPMRCTAEGGLVENRTLIEVRRHDVRVVGVTAPGKAGSSEGWMLMILFFQRQTKLGERMRMKRASTMKSTS